MATKNTTKGKSKGSKSKGEAVQPVAETVEAVQPTTVQPVVEAVRLQSHARGIAFSTTRPGTISAMLEILLSSGPDGVTKQQILDYAVQRCGKCNIATVQMQVPSGLWLEKGIKLTKGKLGYYLTQEEFARYSEAVKNGGLTMKQYAAMRRAEEKAALAEKK